jgi:hypothetical protein
MIFNQTVLIFFMIKTMKKILKLVLILLLITGCNGLNKKEQYPIIYFDLKELPPIENVKLSDMGFNEVKYIPLETNDSSVISKIRDIKFGDSYFLTRFFNSTLMFSENGSFIRKIGTEGRGPKEFLNAHDVEIDPESGNIYLISAFQRKINIYSPFGDLINVIRFPFTGPVTSRFVENNLLIYYYDFRGYNVLNSYILINKQGELLKSFTNKYPYLANKSEGQGIQFENLFYQFNNQLFAKQVYCDTVYMFENNRFKPHLVLDVGKKRITPEVRSQYGIFYIGKNYIQPLNLFEFNDFIYYEFIYYAAIGENWEVYGFIGSKTKDFKFLIDVNEGLINDLDGGPRFLPLVNKGDDAIVGVIEALELKTYVESEEFKQVKPKYPEKKKALESLASKLKDTDNPILIIASFTD